MERKKQSLSEQDFSYFDVQAMWGVTKHFGGVEATDELGRLCQIAKGQTILEVGCGTGVTACRLAKRYDCQVVGVDLSDKMIEWSRKRAIRKSLEQKVQFKAADAQSLPFEDDFFDAVISESVTAFAVDKQKAVSEYARVTKPGGYVGLNEGTWIIASPPTDLVAYLTRTMAGAQFLSADEWRALFANACLTELIVQTFKVNAFSQRINETKGLDFQDRLDRLRSIKDFISLSVSNPNFRRYAKDIMPSTRMLKNLFAYLGYGIYIGRKASSAHSLSVT